MESKSGASTTSFTEISGLRTKEKSAEYLWDRRASDQMSSQKVTVEPSVQSPYLDYLKIIITTVTTIQIMKEFAEASTLNPLTCVLSALHRSDRCHQPVRPVCLALYRFNVAEPVRPVTRTGQTGLYSEMKFRAKSKVTSPQSKFPNALFKINE